MFIKTWWTFLKIFIDYNKNFMNNIFTDHNKKTWWEKKCHVWTYEAFAYFIVKFIYSAYKNVLKLIIFVNQAFLIFIDFVNLSRSFFFEGVIELFIDYNVTRGGRRAYILIISFCRGNYGKARFISLFQSPKMATLLTGTHIQNWPMYLSTLIKYIKQVKIVF